MVVFCNCVDLVVVVVLGPQRVLRTFDYLFEVTLEMMFESF